MLLSWNTLVRKTVKQNKATYDEHPNLMIHRPLASTIYLYLPRSEWRNHTMAIICSLPELGPSSIKTPTQWLWLISSGPSGAAFSIHLILLSFWRCCHHIDHAHLYWSSLLLQELDASHQLGSQNIKSPATDIDESAKEDQCPMIRCCRRWWIRLMQMFLDPAMLMLIVVVPSCWLWSTINLSVFLATVIFATALSCLAQIKQLCISLAW